jgi:predicted secreted protein
MIKRILSICLLLSSINAQADNAFSEIPCTLNDAGLITNDRGFNDGADNLCDFKAAELKLKVYKVALCSQNIVFSGSAPDLSTCSYIFNSDTSSEITVNTNAAFNLDKLTKPATGTYPYILLVTSNSVKIKAQAHFVSLRRAETGGSSGEFCWTDGSTITYDGAGGHNLVNNGISCGDSDIPTSYGFNELIWAGDGSDDPEAVPGGDIVRSFLKADLSLADPPSSTVRTAYVYSLTSPITIASNTSALKMSIDITTGASLVFNNHSIPANRRIKWIEDAPFAYTIEPVNESIF